MASRLLPRVGLSKQFARPMATASHHGSQSTRITVLPNGLTVATEKSSQANAATVGLWIDAGSRVESTNGTAYFMQHLALKGKASAFEKIGGFLTADTTRDHALLAAKTLGANVDQTVQILSDLVQNPQVANVASERAAIIKEQERAESQLGQAVFDHLHATAFQGETLARPVMGTPESIDAITESELSAFKKEHYKANRLVLVGAGDVNHDELVRLAESNLGTLEPSSGQTTKAEPAFTGSDLRLRDDILPAAHVALAVKGAPFLTPEYFNLAVMQAIIGSWDQTLGGAANLSSRLSKTVYDNHLANSFVSFNKGYSDTGLWGMYFVSENRMQLDDFVHFMQKEWVRLSTTVTASEVERAKQQVLAGWLLSLDSTCSVARDIGSQVLATGKRLTAEELKAAVNKITVADIHRTANTFLWDQELAVSAIGPVEGLTDYTRIRGNMSYNRF